MTRFLKSIKDRVRASRREPCFLDPRTMALNFSFVLHERSDSPAVAGHVAAATAHARKIVATRTDRLLSLPVIGADDLKSIRPTAILTASLGFPLVLQHLADATEAGAGLIVADRVERPFKAATLFRAEASLNLPSKATNRLAVAVATMRPGGRSVEIVVRGTFRWPEDREIALRALEDVIRDFALQWHPPRALWDAPVEQMLPEFGAADGE